MKVCKLKLKPRVIQFNNKEYANISYAMAIVKSHRELAELIGDYEEVTLYGLLKETGLQIRSEEDLNKIATNKG